jgi:RNA polymerase sigma-70 factor, ECF subfamily
MNVELVEQARAGDRQAFDVLAATLVDRLYAVARLILHDADAAEDAAQEALVRCWRDLPALRDPTRFDAWLNRLLIRAVHDEFRRDRRERAVITILEVEPSIADSSASLAQRELLQRAFRRMSADHRTVLVLRLYLGLSIDETAAAIGIPVGTTKSRLHYATEAMRLALEADAPRLSQDVTA